MRRLRGSAFIFRRWCLIERESAGRVKQQLEHTKRYLGRDFLKTHSLGSRLWRGHVGQ